MSYLGVRRNSGRQTIIVKVHGPLDKFSLDPQELKDTIDAVVLKNLDKPLSDLPRAIADSVRDVYADGETIVWVTVDLYTNSDVLYGASAERVKVEV
jgi:hypothetical protein